MIGKYLSTSPKIAKTSYIAPSSSVMGKVEVGEHSSIWFGVIARADINEIIIGSYTNVQDGAIIHVDDDLPTHIGDYVTIGHNAIIHGCRIESYALIGMGAIILNGVVIGKGAQIAAGAVVCENFKVPEYTLVMGLPAKVKRDLTKEEKEKNIYWAKKYAVLAKECKGGFTHGKEKDPHC